MKDSECVRVLCCWRSDTEVFLSESYQSPHDERTSRLARRPTQVGSGPFYILIHRHTPISRYSSTDCSDVHAARTSFSAKKEHSACFVIMTWLLRLVFMRLIAEVNVLPMTLAT